MKTTFLVFPAGSICFALLLLRVSVSLSTINDAQSSVSYHHAWVIACGMLALAVSAGFRTRTAAVLSAIVAVAMMAIIRVMPSIACITHVLPAIVLAMAGPGAFSIDARLFGRRTVYIPH